MNGWKARNKSRVLVYKLGGTAELPPLPADERVMPKPLPATASTDTLAMGQKYYQRHCRYSHGDGLRTGGINPDLRWSSEATHEQWDDIVISGGRAALGMVGFGDYITEEQSEAIRQYILSEANRVYAELNPTEAKAVPDET